MPTHKDTLEFIRKYNKNLKIKGYSKMQIGEKIKAVEDALEAKNAPAKVRAEWAKLRLKTDTTTSGFGGSKPPPNIDREIEELLKISDAQDKAAALERVKEVDPKLLLDVMKTIRGRDQRNRYTPAFAVRGDQLEFRDVTPRVNAGGKPLANLGKTGKEFFDKINALRDKYKEPGAQKGLLMVVVDRDTKKTFMTNRALTNEKGGTGRRKTTFDIKAEDLIPIDFYAEKRFYYPDLERKFKKALKKGQIKEMPEFDKYTKVPKSYPVVDYSEVASKEEKVKESISGVKDKTKGRSGAKVILEEDKK